MVTVFAGVRGYTDKVDIGRITEFDARLLAEIRAKGADILNAIRTDKALSEDTEAKLVKFLDDFTKNFA